jgi:hypothetical protein
LFAGYDEQVTSKQLYSIDKGGAVYREVRNPE